MTHQFVTTNEIPCCDDRQLVDLKNQNKISWPQNKQQQSQDEKDRCENS